MNKFTINFKKIFKASMRFIGKLGKMVKTSQFVVSVFYIFYLIKCTWLGMINL